MALLRSSMPSSRKAERSTPTPAAAAAAPGAAKKKVSAGAAWREARLLIHAHRGRLAMGLGLMLISRLAGLVLPASAKYVDRRRDRQGPARTAAADRSGRRRRHHRAGGELVRPVADSRRRRPARHHRHAQAGPSQGDAAAGALLRLDPDRHPGVAHHVRRRRPAKPGRNRAGAAGRRPGHRHHRPGRAAVFELASDHRHGGGARDVRRRHGLRLQEAAAAVSRARQDQR